jgi:hypothetical protein
MVNRDRGRAFSALGLLMIVFGVAEVVTAFRHQFFVIQVHDAALFTPLGAVLGLCYVAAGALVLVDRRRTLTLAGALLAVDVVGRVVLVVTGAFPMETLAQTIGMLIGTMLVACFCVLVVARTRSLRS